MLKNGFLLSTEKAKALYDSVKALPIIDYHNHLSLADVSQNRRFLDVYDLWIAPDPYKHRAMRMVGVEEYYITGGATKEEKFVKWCETIGKLSMHPLSHWSYMELERVFGVTEKIDGANAKKLYAYCNQYLQEKEVTVDTLLSFFNVEYACPCASLVDDLALFGEDKRLAPSLRGDDIVAVTESFVQKLEGWTGMKIDGLAAFERGVSIRLDAFKTRGCAYSDHALDNGFVFYEDDGKNAERFTAALQGNITAADKQRLASYLLVFLGKEYAKRGFVMQLHIGAERYTSSKLRKAAGAAGGFAGIGNSVDARSLTQFLDAVDCTEYGLPKTLLFTLNPSDNALVSVLSGSYSKDSVAGLVTQGPAWWWCDHKLGIVDMLENTAAFGLLSNFVGMTTDSRSFLSFVRHEYFRRILCDWLAQKWTQGELLCDEEELVDLAKKLCYQNAKNSVL